MLGFIHFSGISELSAEETYNVHFRINQKSRKVMSKELRCTTVKNKMIDYHYFR